MTRSSPVVTATMAAYNAEQFIGEAIDSILSQTFTDWELIIVDDGSTDCTQQIAESYASYDTRIQVIRLPENQGRPVASNVAVDAARGQFIAVTDADDVSLPHRFEIQTQFMFDDPDLGILSAQVATIDEYGRRGGYSHVYPTDESEIRAKFKRGRMAIANPAAMIRSEVFDAFSGYALKCKRGQDFEFFLRVLDTVGMCNLPDVLVLYRKRAESRSLRAIRESSLYGRYAVYHSNQVKLGAMPAPFDEFERSLPQRGMCYALDVAVYFREMLGHGRTFGRGSRS